MSTEIELLESQLNDEQDGHDMKTERISKLEKDLRDMRVQLEQKIELGTVKWYLFLYIYNTNIKVPNNNT
jgi:hypothetical protein